MASSGEGFPRIAISGGRRPLSLSFRVRARKGGYLDQSLRFARFDSIDIAHRVGQADELRQVAVLLSPLSAGNSQGCWAHPLSGGQTLPEGHASLPQTHAAGFAYLAMNLISGPD